MRIRYLEHRRLFFIINCQSLFIAAGKGITFWRINQSRGHSRNGIKRILSDGRGRKCPHQALCVWMTRIVKNLIGCSNLHDLSGIHDRHTICHMSHRAQIMGNKYDGCTQFFLNITKQIQDLRLHSHIQRCGRLIRKDNFRISGQRHRQHGTLPHAAGKLMRILTASLTSSISSSAR